MAMAFAMLARARQESGEEGQYVNTPLPPTPALGIEVSSRANRGDLVGDDC